MTADKKSIFREIADRLPSDQRPVFWEMAAHLENLPPEDEILRICQAMGVLALVVQRIPSELAVERESWSHLYNDLTTRFKTIIENERRCSEELTCRVNGLVQEISVVRQAVKTEVDEVKHALRESASGFSLHILEMAIRSKLELAVLQPAQDTVRRSGEAVQRLNDAVPSFERTAERLENFNYKNAWRTSFLVCAAGSIIVISGMGSFFLNWYVDAKKTLQANYERNSQVLEELDKTHHTINLFEQDNKIYITIPSADSAYMSTSNDGVIVVKP